jgi:hypothetical protein
MKTTLPTSILWEYLHLNDRPPKSFIQEVSSKKCLHCIYILTFLNIIISYIHWPKNFKKKLTICNFINIIPKAIDVQYILYSAFGKSLCTYKRCWKWCPRVSTQAWNRLILFTNTYCRSAFRKSLCTYTRCWKWCPRASIQAWTHLILFATLTADLHSESHCALTQGVGSDVHEWLYRPEPAMYHSLSAQWLSERTV